MAKKGDGKQFGISLFGLLLFLLFIPFFLQMGGGRWILAEALPGQVPSGGISLKSLWTEEESLAAASGAVWGVDDVEFRQKNGISSSRQPQNITADVLEQMKEFSYLKNNFYIVDSRTALLENDVNVEEALSLDFSIEQTKKEPKVLIFHTHSHEGFADSDMSKGLEQGIWGVGEELKNILETEYGVGVIHDTGQYDVVDGKGQITGAYERMEPQIRKILEENPSIEVCIDLHRDGVGDDVRLVTDVNGKQTAKIMFFNGLCRLNKDGTVTEINGLTNDYLKENMAFSLQMQVAAGQKFPGYTRKIYLNPYRFSLHMMPRSTLVEVGAQTNTRQEAINAMEPLAAILADVLQVQPLP